MVVHKNKSIHTIPRRTIEFVIASRLPFDHIIDPLTFTARIARPWACSAYGVLRGEYYWIPWSGEVKSYCEKLHKFGCIIYRLLHCWCSKTINHNWICVWNTAISKSMQIQRKKKEASHLARTGNSWRYLRIKTFGCTYSNIVTYGDLIFEFYSPEYRQAKNSFKFKRIRVLRTKNDCQLQI